MRGQYAPMECPRKSWGGGGASTLQMEALAKQKAENIAGFVFVVIAFVLTIISIAFVPDGVRVFESKWLALSLAVMLAVGLYLTMRFVSQGDLPPISQTPV